MPFYEPDVVAEAKKLDLLTYLQNYEPQELVHVSGNVYCTKTHDSLRISNGKWCWFSQGIGGKSALDYLIKVNGYSFLEAMERIVGQAAAKPPAPVPAKSRKSPRRCCCRRNTAMRNMRHPIWKNAAFHGNSFPFAFPPGGCMRATPIIMWFS